MTWTSTPSLSMSASRAGTSVISRQAVSTSLAPDLTLGALEGVISRKPPLPAGLGKRFPSISHNTLMSAYSVSSGTSVITGRRGYMEGPMSSHIPSDSDMCVSASMTSGMLSSLVSCPASDVA